MGRYGMAALPLMTGVEEVEQSGSVSKYTKDRTLQDMHITLVSRVGYRIRILRGDRLESPLAPKAGVRYDGL